MLDLDVPDALGTPGLVNSMFRANGAQIGRVVHHPTLPRGDDVVVVEASVKDRDGVGRVQLVYRLDPGDQLQRITMTDDGAGRDRIALDGCYSRGTLN